MCSIYQLAKFWSELPTNAHELSEIGLFSPPYGFRDRVSVDKKWIRNPVSLAIQTVFARLRLEAYHSVLTALYMGLPTIDWRCFPTSIAGFG